MIAAEALLRALRANGVEHVFANAGSDFAPVIEALAGADSDAIPEMVAVAHEAVAVAMAHGFWLATGRMQAAMVHVNVGLANAVMGLINAHSDDVPVMMLAGRTPLTETGRTGSRTSPIQYGQEQFDQTGMVRDLVKWSYELRHGDQVAGLIDRAASVARAAPSGAVYLGLPREPLCEEVPAPPARPRQVAPVAPVPDPVAIAEAAARLARAERPLILCSRGDASGAVSEALAALLAHRPMPVAEVFVTRNVLPSRHPCMAGPNLARLLSEADAVLVLDTPVAWIESAARPAEGAFVCHVGPDPLFGRLPVRGYRADMSIAGDVAAALRLLREALPARDADDRTTRLHAAFRDRVDAMWKDGATGIASKAWLGKCLSDALAPHGGVVVAERGPTAAMMDMGHGGTFFGNTQAGGLGWAMPAALGMQFADRDRLVACAIGDGSYMFANPVACHHVAAARHLPLLTVVANNSAWDAVRTSTTDVFPDGAASRANTMPMTRIEAAPDFCAVARSCDAHALRVETADALPDAMAEAVRVVREERRQVLLDVVVRPD